ncbi:MAG: hypothetical protein WD872_08620 [Pirellulaceae bacterium]
MTVRCAHCGEELLGAVNRCWKCGRQFANHPGADGLPPVRAELAASLSLATSPATAEPLEARVLDDDDAMAAIQTAVWIAAPAPPPDQAAASYPPTPLPPHPLATPAPPPPDFRRPAYQRPNFAALGGAYGALLLGVFALLLAPFRYEAAIIALFGLLMGIWGIYSPRRGWALIGMLLCAIAMGWGTFTGVQMIYRHLQRNTPIEMVEPMEEEETAY